MAQLRLFIGMYYPKENTNLTGSLVRDLKRIQICHRDYPACVVITAASGTNEPRYPERDLCQQDRHMIYSLGPRGKTLLRVLPICDHYNDMALYQVSLLPIRFAKYFHASYT